MGERSEHDRAFQSGPSGRRFTLRSGQVVEVIRPQQPLAHCLPSALHVCRRCGSELVQPLECRDVDADRWELALQCPNCGWSRHGTFPVEQLSELEEHVDSGFDELLHDFKRLRAANMTEEIERFRAALQADLILPEDF